jgi:hypothetical protein
MSIASIPPVVSVLDTQTLSQQSANPSSPDYVTPPAPHPGPAPARLPDMAYQASSNAGYAAAVLDSSTTQQLTAVQSALLTIEPASVAPLSTAPQPLQQPGPIKPTLQLTL